MSRTLSLRSRHEPEWATQTRKVTRPEDIVINRDRERVPSSATEKEMEEGRVGASGSETDAAKATEQALDREAGVKNELVKKWREGRHLVIEHHSKVPGAEVGQILVPWWISGLANDPRQVQVEVIRNAYEGGPLPNLKNAVHQFTATPQTIREDVLKYLHSFTPRTSTDETKEATAPIQKSPESPTGNTSRPASVSSKKGKAVTIETPPEAIGSKAPSVIADDENDEWEDEPASEASELDAEAHSHHSSLPKKKYHHASKGRRRESFRRSALARHTVAVYSPSPSDSGDAAGSDAGAMPPPTPMRSLSLGQRPSPAKGGSEPPVIPPGDPSGRPRPTLHSHDSGSGLRNRFDRLKNDEMGGSSSRVRTRESSPARVIRFAQQAPPDRTPAQTAPPSDDEHTSPAPGPGNTQLRHA
jgi:hypothetical protein